MPTAIGRSPKSKIYAHQELERQTEAYYRSLSKAERKEDRQWTHIAARSAKRRWE